MFERFDLFPEAASDFAADVDRFYFFLVLVTVAFTLLVAGLLVFFSVRYRRARSPRPTPIHGSLPLEILWSGIPLVLSMVMFGWGAKLYFQGQAAPADGLEILVTGKQWMWKLQHPTGQREINELHVPTGVPVVLTMTSEDVIHSFYVPAMRIKRDVVPGRYSRLWFEAHTPGTYHLFCAEYCGTKHAEMIGSVIVMEPAEYQAWLDGSPANETPVQAGARLFESLRCVTCHAAGAGQKGPELEGIYGTQRLLATGGTVVADEDYIRESILRPNARQVAGYEPLMPTFQGQVNETQILALIAYLKSIGPERPAPEEGP